MTQLPLDADTSGAPDLMPADEPEPPRPGPIRRAWRAVRPIVETVGLGLLFYFLISNFALQPFKVEQTSMEPTVEPGEYVLVDKLVTGLAGYHRGDVVVLHVPLSAAFPTEPTAPLIKRVVATAGEHLQIKDGAVYINGEKLSEPYLPDGVTTEMSDGGVLDTVIPAGDVWVMGDHRGASTDSRVFGPVPVSDIIGHALLRYWPFDRFGVLDTAPYRP